MGRAHSTPEVERYGEYFYITRVCDPDDEFASRQVMEEDFVFVDWESMTQPFMAQEEDLAHTVLRAWNAGRCAARDEAYIGWM